jgi:hypothetical protein
MYIHLYMHKYMHINVNIYVCACRHDIYNIHTYMYIYTHTYVYNIHTNIHVWLCIHIHVKYSNPCKIRKNKHVSMSTYTILRAKKTYPVHLKPIHIKIKFACKFSHVHTHILQFEFPDLTLHALKKASHRMFRDKRHVRTLSLCMHIRVHTAYQQCFVDFNASLRVDAVD